MADSGHRAGYVDAGQSATAIERTIADGGDGVGYNRVHATINELVGSSINDGITVVAGIIVLIITLHLYVSQTAAVIKYSATDASDRAGYGNACQFATAREGIFANE